MANVTALGLSKIEVGAVNADAKTGTWEALGKTFENTCKMTEDEPTTQDFYCEEEDDPQETIVKRGKTVLTWSIMNITAATAKEVFGGEFDDASKTWKSPSKIFTAEKAVKITPEIGCTFVLPRVKFWAKVTADFSKQGLFLAECSATILTPDAGRGRLEIIDPA